MLEMTRRNFLKGMCATTALAAGVILLPVAVVQQLPDQRAVFEQYWRDICEKIVNPPLMMAMDDMMTFGSGAIQVGPGGVNHMPLAKLIGPMLPAPDVKWFTLEAPKGETYGRGPLNV